MAVRIETQAEPIPGYRLLERLGGGGFGEVWKAVAPGGLHKAIKFVYGDLQQLGEEGHRAEQELKALSRVKTVRHPYILSLERFDVIDGQLIIVMELADRNLWDRFKECRAAGLPGIPRDELLGYMEETAEALDLMNNQYQLQHLDIKPQNLFLVFNHVKVADFGLVKDLEGMQASVTGGVTPVYAAPETFDGWVSRFSDQYSLAIVYQELLTGQRPFTGGNVRQLVLQHLQAAPNLSSLPPYEQPLIARALAKNPDDRFPTCADLIRGLRELGTRNGNLGPAGSSGFRVPTAELPEEDGTGTIRLNRLQEAAPRISETPPPSTAHTVQPIAPPPEQTGDGVMFPALIVGVGQVALTVMQDLRRLLHERFGNLGVLPHLRFLYIDTDPDVLRTATRGDPGMALSSAEIVLATLNRPAHYLRPGGGRLSIESWFNPRMLYRIPRTHVTLGCRALGRLAFVDHYRAISHRLRLELEACLDPQALSDAVAYTGLGLRTTRPRVYVIANLAGGTGSGMFLDLAYVIRAQLRQLGYHQPDLSAILLAPPPPVTDGMTARAPAKPLTQTSTPAARNTERATRNSKPGALATGAGPRCRPFHLALGNTVAALVELSFFATQENSFFARYHENEPPVRDAEPPFGRTILLPLEEAPGFVSDAGLPDSSTSGSAADFLARELCSELGRAIDLCRAGLPAPPWLQRGLFYNTFGMYCLTSPHRALVQKLARKLCADLCARWLSKDTTPVKQAAAEWTAQVWEQEGWTPQALSHHLQELAEKIIGQQAAAALSQILTSLVVQFRPAEHEPARAQAQSRGREHIKDVAQRDFVQPDDVPYFQKALQQIEAVVGWPPEEETMDRSAPLPEGLCNGVDALVACWVDRVAHLVVRAIEQPGFRLAGAEEVVRQIIGKIEAVLTPLEAKTRDGAKAVSDTYARIKAVLQAFQEVSSEEGSRSRGVEESRNSSSPGPKSRRERASEKKPAPRSPPTILIADLVELLRCYAQWRFDDLLRQHLVSLYVSLRGHWSDEVREINYCRVRLGELHQTFAGPGAAGCAGVPETRGAGAWLAARDQKRTTNPQPPTPNPQPRSWSRHLLPDGCDSLEETVEKYLQNVTESDLLELDGLMQEMIRRDFQALVHVCLSSANVVKELEQAMQQEAEAFVAPRLGGTNPAELFLSQAGDDERAFAELQTVYDEAAPQTHGRMVGQPGAEVTVLLAPPGPEGSQLHQLAAGGLSEGPREITAVSGGEDIVLYREVAHLPLVDLEVLQTAGQEAYRQMSAVENFTPHTRTDISFPGPLGSK